MCKSPDDTSARVRSLAVGTARLSGPPARPVGRGRLSAGCYRSRGFENGLEARRRRDRLAGEPQPSDKSGLGSRRVPNDPGHGPGPRAGRRTRRARPRRAGNRGRFGERSLTRRGSRVGRGTLGSVTGSGRSGDRLRAINRQRPEPGTSDANLPEPSRAGQREQGANGVKKETGHWAVPKAMRLTTGGYTNQLSCYAIYSWASTRRATVLPESPNFPVRLPARTPAVPGQTERQEGRFGRVSRTKPSHWEASGLGQASRHPPG